MRKILVVVFMLVAMSSFAEWTVSDRVDPMDDTRIVDLVGITDETTDTGEWQALVLRSRSDETFEAFVVWGSYFSEYEPVSVTVRIDNQTPFNLSANAGVNGTVLFFRIPFLFIYSAINAKERILVRATTLRGTVETIEFRMEGAQELFDRYSDMFPTDLPTDE